MGSSCWCCDGISSFLSAPFFPFSFSFFGAIFKIDFFFPFFFYPQRGGNCSNLLRRAPICLYLSIFFFWFELLFGVTTTSMTSIDARCERDFPASPTSGKGGREGKEEGGRRRKKIKTNYLASLASSTSSLTRLNNLTTTPGSLALSLS